MKYKDIGSITVITAAVLTAIICLAILANKELKMHEYTGTIERVMVEDNQAELTIKTDGGEYINNIQIDRDAWVEYHKGERITAKKNDYWSTVVDQDQE